MDFCTLRVSGYEVLVCMLVCICVCWQAVTGSSSWSSSIWTDRLRSPSYWIQCECQRKRCLISLRVCLREREREGEGEGERVSNSISDLWVSSRSIWYFSISLWLQSFSLSLPFFTRQIGVKIHLFFFHRRFYLLSYSQSLALIIYTSVRVWEIWIHFLISDDFFISQLWFRLFFLGCKSFDDSHWFIYVEW